MAKRSPCQAQYSHWTDAEKELSLSPDRDRAPHSPDTNDSAMRVLAPALPVISHRYHYQRIPRKVCGHFFFFYSLSCNYRISCGILICLHATVFRSQAVRIMYKLLSSALLRWIMGWLCKNNCSNYVYLFYSNLGFCLG